MRFIRSRFGSLAEWPKWLLIVTVYGAWLTVVCLAERLGPWASTALHSLKFAHARQRPLRAGAPEPDRLAIFFIGNHMVM